MTYTLKALPSRLIFVFPSKKRHLFNTHRLFHRNRNLQNFVLHQHGFILQPRDLNCTARKDSWPQHHKPLNPSLVHEQPSASPHEQFLPAQRCAPQQRQRCVSSQCSYQYTDFSALANSLKTCHSCCQHGQSAKGNSQQCHQQYSKVSEGWAAAAPACAWNCGVVWVGIAKIRVPRAEH